MSLDYDEDDKGDEDEDESINACLAGEGECMVGSMLMIINVHSTILHVGNYPNYSFVNCFFLQETT